MSDAAAAFLRTELLREGGVVVLSGAGISTDSGIPDYRGPSGALRRPLPMTYQEFVADPAARQLYWARSQLGWRIINDAAPNAAHRAVTTFQRLGLLAGVLTQNVDGLHGAAGTSDVVELHGNLAHVRCLGCQERTSRTELDARLRAANRGWEATVTALNPDGDVTLADGAAETFQVVHCRCCGGTLKPDVVFFGENVAPPKVARAYDLVAACRGLLVLGSSLSVMSGLRFVRRAAALGLPIVIVSQGWTRGDDLATHKIDARLGEVLPGLAADLSAASAPA